jgi:hypothetical protein
MKGMRAFAERGDRTWLGSLVNLGDIMLMWEDKQSFDVFTLAWYFLSPG